MYLVIKRLFDFLAAAVLLTVLFPVLLIVAIALAWYNKGTPFFFQQRPGWNEKIFWLVKFKTMNDKKGSDGRLLPDAQRLTPFGKFIRKSSLDELPQLLNVLKGDMSFIGPRPLLVGYLPLYNEEQRKRHLVRPGITGWAQVNGRNAIGWSKKFELDVWYVNHISFSLDCKILVLTLLKIVKREGINASDAATMKSFTGN